MKPNIKVYCHNCYFYKHVNSYTLEVYVKQFQWSIETSSTRLWGITPGVWLSANWLGSCHQRPGCQGNRPLSSPVLIRFPLLNAPCLFPSSKGKCSQTSCAYIYVCMCLWTWVLHACFASVCVCVLVTACYQSRRVATLSPGDGLRCQSVAAAHNKSVSTELEIQSGRVVLCSLFPFLIILSSTFVPFPILFPLSSFHLRLYFLPVSSSSLLHLKTVTFRLLLASLTFESFHSSYSFHSSV